jgi:hypothetical protein
MTYADHKTSIAPVPLVTGILLWAAATALMLEDCYRAGSWDAAHIAVPILTASTCVAGCLAHMRLVRFRVLSGLALAALALFGSALCVLNTLSRTATDRDRTIAVAMAQNRVLHDRQGELDRARVEMTRECKARGPRCREWESRVDALQRETAPMLALAVDPRSDAVARLAVLAGLDGERTKQIMKAVEPAALPIFLELGAIILLGISFPVRKPVVVIKPQTIAEQLSTIAPQTFTREQALQDLKTLREAGSGRYLAQRWGVDPSTASRWLQSFEVSGAIDRNRAGKAKAILIAPPVRKKVLTFKHQPRNRA